MQSSKLALASVAVAFFTLPCRAGESKMERRKPAEKVESANAGDTGLDPLTQGLTLVEYQFQCKGMRQSRRFSINSDHYTWIDEAGEVQRGKLVSKEVEALRANLQGTGFTKIATEPRTIPETDPKKARCTTSVALLLDGKRYVVEETEKRQISEASRAAWARVLTILNAFINAHL